MRSYLLGRTSSWPMRRSQKSFRTRLYPEDFGQLIQRLPPKSVCPSGLFQLSDKLVHQRSGVVTILTGGLSLMTSKPFCCNQEPPSAFGSIGCTAFGYFSSKTASSLVCLLRASVSTSPRAREWGLQRKWLCKLSAGNDESAWEELDPLVFWTVDLWNAATVRSCGGCS